MHRYLFSLVILVISFFTTTAQENRISISPDYSIPIGNLSWYYKPSGGIQLNYSRVDDNDDVLKSFGVTIGYTVLKPIADTLYFISDHGGFGGIVAGVAVYSPFKMLQLKGTMDFSIPLNDRIYVNLGGGIGFNYGSRTTYVDDGFGGIDESEELIGWGIITPKVGIEFMLNDNISLSPYFAYNFMVQLGSTNPKSVNYNEDTGKYYQFYSPGLSLNFTF